MWLLIFDIDYAVKSSINNSPNIRNYGLNLFLSINYSYVWSYKIYFCTSYLYYFKSSVRILESSQDINRSIHSISKLSFTLFNAFLINASN